MEIGELLGKVQKLLNTNSGHIKGRIYAVGLIFHMLTWFC